MSSVTATEKLPPGKTVSEGRWKGIGSYTVLSGFYIYRQAEIPIKAGVCLSEFDLLANGIAAVDKFYINILTQKIGDMIGGVGQISFQPDIFSGSVGGFIQVQVNFFLRRSVIVLLETFAEAFRKSLLGQHNIYGRKCYEKQNEYRSFHRTRLHYKFG